MKPLLFLQKKLLIYVTSLVGIVWSLFQLYTNSFWIVNPFTQRSLHVMFCLMMIFLTCPTLKRRQSRRDTVFSATLALIAFLPGIWVTVNAERYLTRYEFVDPVYPLDLIFGIIMILLLLEATRRSLGPAFTALASFFLFYGFFGPLFPGLMAHRGIPLEDMVEFMFMSTRGIFGIPVGVSATYVYIFILFAAFLYESGASNLFTDVALGLFGRSRGGPAKAAVVGSSLFGTISGSAAANVAATGTFTIPLMKGIGYPPHVAGAVEAVASTGGQIMPPIMGAAAFVVAEYVGVPYIIICLHAAIPAILYYAALFFMVDFEARKMGLKGLSKEQLPDVKKSVLNYGHIFVSVIVLLYFLVTGYTASMAAFFGVIAACLVSFIRKTTRLGVKGFLRALEAGARMAASVAAACAGAGLIIGVLDITGLGLKFSSIVTKAAGGNLFLLLILVMVTAVILGMGMPTTAAYITVAVLMVPALLDIGVSPLAAHMFAFYYACLSLYTPPVATASYVAAGLAGADALRTGINSMKLGSSLLIVPFMFVFAPSLLFIGAPLEILWTMFSSLIGVFALGGALVGFIVKGCGVIERGLLLVAAIALIFPEVITDLIGFGLLGAVLAIQSPLTFRRLIRYIKSPSR